jgi:hypothetical protein
MGFKDLSYSIKYGIIFSLIFAIISLLLFFIVKFSASPFMAVILGLLNIAGVIIVGFYALINNGFLSVGSLDMTNTAAFFLAFIISFVFWFFIGWIVGKIKSKKQ